ncbi:cationic amino acid transporter 3-like isoform X1 [Ovis aries]|nr:cationic amino acid transporter 3-like isoform X1 [Ovis aries]XP_042088325.1 cationic amino acid transporter 3-like [Ovis aries]XP_042088326.1 cationic amino acid transporter 3-like [Ovis aries]XP_042088327.1 cationic amino acid transporter 3-like [Ovis aries]XP_042088328.1 cationic amino acid transporter 3-like [Ovis aries]XP_042088329.1 cationic amino acid transporter 3-like isoform X1 [Ovis aries]XP_042088331.1 cationic amino acid transporter 3-like [Ovis aries]
MVSSTMSRILCQYVLQFGQKLVCRRPLEPIEESESPTAHLNILDLVVLGVGRSLGAGVYVLIGFIAKLIAGPSVVICFLVDSLSSVLFGLCYAELGARMPRFDSVYLHSYVILGQLCAFVIGWNLILSLFVGTACVAKAWSIAFDSLTGNHISQALEGTFSPYMPSALATFPDFVALGPLLLITGVLVLGVPVSAWIIKVFTSLNILIPIFMIVSGFIKGDLHNWRLTEQDYKNTSGASDISRTGGLGPLGSGGFVPFGFEGILHGAAVFFRSYFGFDVIVTKGREARNPQRSVPLSMVISIFICFLAYSAVSAALTLMVPYYQLHHYNPLPQAFFHVGWAPAGYVMAVVFLCTLLYSLLGAMFVLSRLICAMADDGLLFRGLGWIHAGTHRPIMAILASGTLAAIIALPFELRDIVEFMLIGIMLAYTFVAFSVLVLRYQADQNFSTSKKTEEETEMGPVIEESASGSIPEAGMSNFLKSLWFPASTIPTQKSGQIVYGCVFLLVLLLSILSLILAQWPRRVFSGDPVLTTVAVLLLLLITGVSVIIWRQPQDPSPLYFKVPALPVLPLVSIFVNIYLMVQITSGAWVQFGIWNAIGFVIYFGYGIRHSLAGNDEPQPPASNSRT